jgi:hypothetical protein
MQALASGYNSRITTRNHIQIASGSLHCREAMLFYRHDSTSWNAYVNFNLGRSFGTIRSGYYRPAGSGGGDYGAYQQGFDFWAGGGVNEDDGISNQSVPAGTETAEQLVALVKNGVIELPAPGLPYANNPFADAEDPTTFFAYSEGFDPSQIIMQGTGIGVYNESQYDTPESGSFQSLVAFVGNHDEPKPWS